jgi:hypothetical protein
MNGYKNCIFDDLDDGIVYACRVIVRGKSGLMIAFFFQLH